VHAAAVAAGNAAAAESSRLYLTPRVKWLRDALPVLYDRLPSRYTARSSRPASATSAEGTSTQLPTLV
jgi:hypothetical protein